MSVLASLDRLDHRLAGSPEAPYVFEARKWRLRLAVVVLLTLVSFAIAVATTAHVAGWVLVGFALATGVRTAIARPKATPAGTGRWYEV